MKELVVTGRGGDKQLTVYPALPDNAPNKATAAAGCVEALQFWPEGKEALPPVWGVRVNIAYVYPMDRQQSRYLIDAIKRCWEWIDDPDSRA